MTDVPHEPSPSADASEPEPTEQESTAAHAAEEEAGELARLQVEGEPLPSGQGPDPVIGAGVTLTGIFVMAVGGSRDLHYVFDVGVLVAVLGAGIFVLFVALSAMKMRKVEKEASASSGEGDPGHELPRVN